MSPAFVLETSLRLGDFTLRGVALVSILLPKSLVVFHDFALCEAARRNYLSAVGGTSCSALSHQDIYT